MRSLLLHVYSNQGGHTVLKVLELQYFIIIITRM